MLLFVFSLLRGKSISLEICSGKKFRLFRMKRDFLLQGDIRGKKQTEAAYLISHNSRGYLWIGSSCTMFTCHAIFDFVFVYSTCYIDFGHFQWFYNIVYVILGKYISQLILTPEPFFVCTEDSHWISDSLVRDILLQGLTISLFKNVLWRELKKLYIFDEQLRSSNWLYSTTTIATTIFKSSASQLSN